MAETVSRINLGICGPGSSRAVQWTFCFPIREVKSQKFLGIHYHHNDLTSNEWYVHPNGIPMQAAIIGDHRTAEIIFIGESQWDLDRGFVGAGRLAPGATLSTRSEESVQITEIEPRKQGATVYNLEIENFHTFFVGNGGVWVHNMKETDAY